MTMQIYGLDELITLFGEHAPREGKNLMRNALADIAKDAAKEIKSGFSPYRRTGNLDAQVAGMRLRGSKEHILAGVKMTSKKAEIKPKAEGKTSRISKKQQLRNANGAAFYWKFLDTGTKHIAAKNISRPIKQKYAANMPALLREAWGKKLEKRLAKLGRTRG